MSQIPNASSLVLQLPEQRYAPARQPDQIIVPPRVQVAMQLISMLNQKTESTIVPGGGPDGFKAAEKFNGQELTPSELLAHTAACELVEQYFAGKFIPDLWEKPIHAAVTKRSRSVRKPKRVAHRIHCPECQQNGLHADCLICGGDGSMMLVRRKDL